MAPRFALEEKEIFETGYDESDVETDKAFSMSRLKSRWGEWDKESRIDVLGMNYPYGVTYFHDRHGENLRVLETGYPIMIPDFSGAHSKSKEWNILLGDVAVIEIDRIKDESFSPRFESATLWQSKLPFLSHIKYIQVKTAKEFELSKDVIEFSSHEGLWGWLIYSLELAKEHFSNYQTLLFEIEQDPETDEKWIVLELVVEGEIKDIRQSYREFKRIWVSIVPWPESNKIRFSYNIV